MAVSCEGRFDGDEHVASNSWHHQRLTDDELSLKSRGFSKDCLCSRMAIHLVLLRQIKATRMGCLLRPEFDGGSGVGCDAGDAVTEDFAIVFVSDVVHAGKESDIVSDLIPA